jgi:hypothetical protein
VCDRAGCVEGSLFGVRIRVASLVHLIALLEAAGGPKDLLTASEYRFNSDELRRPHDNDAS